MANNINNINNVIRKTAYDLVNTDSLDTPALIFHEDIIEANTDKIIEIAGGANRLWPHVKSHKSQHMVRMQQKKGITRFKCATIAEAEMLARCEARHVLLAYPLAGPSIKRFIRLQLMYPSTMFYAIGDDLSLLEKLSEASVASGITTQVLIDVDMGMHRTGVSIDELESFYRAASSESGAAEGVRAVKGAGAGKSKGVHICGFHCYDGNHNDPDITKRAKDVKESNEKIFAICSLLKDKRSGKGRDKDMYKTDNDNRDLTDLILVMGGTPTFPCHAGYPSVYLSPGTAFLMDHGYMRKYADLSSILTPGAVLATRVISRPDSGLFTLDLGSKGIATDPAGVRGAIAGFEDKAIPVLQSEEHWVFRMADGNIAEMPEIGEMLYVIPTHICPTTALYTEVSVARGGHIVNIWDVTARNRRITV